MRHNKLALYAHFVWSTWDRLPLIGMEIERQLWRAIQEQAELMGCEVIAAGGVEDHVHILVSFPPTVALCDIVKQMKGATSLFVNDELAFQGGFRWQASYAAFSVSWWDVSKVRKYIQNQREHHENGTAKHQLELNPMTEIHHDKI